MSDNFQKLTSDSKIIILAIQDLLEQNNIESIVKDNYSSAITAGFGAIGQSVDIFVHNSDLPKATQLLQEFQNNQE